MKPIYDIITTFTNALEELGLTDEESRIIRTVTTIDGELRASHVVNVQGVPTTTGCVEYTLTVDTDEMLHVENDVQYSAAIDIGKHPDYTAEELGNLLLTKLPLNDIGEIQLAGEDTRGEYLGLVGRFNEDRARAWGFNKMFKIENASYSGALMTKHFVGSSTEEVPTKHYLKSDVVDNV